MQKLFEQIETVSKENINDLVDAVIKRYHALFPDWEISTISIRKIDDRNKQLDTMIGMLENMKVIH